MFNAIRYLPVILVLIFGVFLSIYLFNSTTNKERLVAQSNFNDSALESMIAIENRIRNALITLHSIVGLYQSSNFVDRSEFKSFASIALREIDIQALEWIPVVPNKSRLKFETSALEDGFSDFHFKEKSAEGKLISAKPRDTYYPVYYVEPYKGNEGALGFDLGSNPVRLAALEKAKDTGQAVISGKINLVQIKKDNAAVLVFVPIYSKSMVNNSLEQRRKNITGFALGVIRITTLVSGLLNRTQLNLLRSPSEIDIYLYDEDVNENEQLIYMHQSQKRTAKQAPRLTLAEATSSPHEKQSLIFGTRKWTIIAKPHDLTFSGSVTNQRWLVSIISLLAIMMLSLLIFHVMRRSAVIENLVKERTEQLAQTTRKAKKDEEHIRAIVENSAEAIITIDSYGEIQSANPATEIIFGYKVNELIGNSISMLITPEERSMHATYLKKSKLNETRILNKSREIIGYRKNGERFSMELNVSVMNVDDQRLYIGIMHDVSERKQAEVLKAEFVSTVSHELRTPLTSIKGSLGLVRSGELGTLPDAVNGMLDIAYSNCDRQIRLVNDLLDMEKIAAGKMDFKMMEVDLNEIIDTAVIENKEYGSTYNVTFKVQHTISPKKIYADEARIIQVLANLLSNAAKFSPQGSEVNINLQESGEYYQVCVTDTGPGIPENYRNKIFERFSQADSSDTRQKGGTGLGLCISKAIIEKHHGDLYFDTEIGSGTTFYFEIPKLD